MTGHAKRSGSLSIMILAVCIQAFPAQETTRPLRIVQVTAHLSMQHLLHQSVSPRASRSTPAVFWLKPLQADAVHPTTPGNFTLLQKDKMFTPHLLVVPVGSSVSFPNADPFFHNVFSLFDGRRFDLGLYEAGSSRSVLFSREGVSYIFCNIHPEMSAVVISLSTPYSSVADAQGVFHVKDVPQGEYELHVWVEGRRQSSLDSLTRRVHVGGDTSDLGEIGVGQPEQGKHTNKFGRPYEADPKPIY